MEEYVEVVELETRREFRKYGLLVVLDRNQINKDDPGAGTPAMVYFNDENGICGSLDCAIGEQEIGCGEYVLSYSQLKWLDEIRDIADDFFRE